MNFYSKDVRKDLDFINKCAYFNEWYEIVKDILNNEEFQKRKLFLHHEDSVWHHCIIVSFNSFLLAKYYMADARICAIAGLLHDFYPKAWQYSEELYNYDKEYLNTSKGIRNLHGFVHAKQAAVNYVKYFPELEDDKITDAIKRHMFPLNIIPPKYKEGWIVTLVDKQVSFSSISIKELPKYVGLKKLFNFNK